MEQSEGAPDARPGDFSSHHLVLESRKVAGQLEQAAFLANALFKCRPAPASDTIVESGEEVVESARVAAPSKPKESEAAPVDAGGFDPNTEEFFENLIFTKDSRLVSVLKREQASNTKLNLRLTSLTREIETLKETHMSIVKENKAFSDQIDLLNLKCCDQELKIQSDQLMIESNMIKSLQSEVKILRDKCRVQEIKSSQVTDRLQVLQAALRPLSLTVIDCITYYKELAKDSTTRIDSMAGDMSKCFAEIEQQLRHYVVVNEQHREQAKSLCDPADTLFDAVSAFHKKVFSRCHAARIVDHDDTPKVQYTDGSPFGMTKSKLEHSYKSLLWTGDALDLLLLDYESKIAELQKRAAAPVESLERMRGVLMGKTPKSYPTHPTKRSSSKNVARFRDFLPLDPPDDDDARSATTLSDGTSAAPPSHIEAGEFTESIIIPTATAEDTEASASSVLIKPPPKKARKGRNSVSNSNRLPPIKQ